MDSLWILYEHRAQIQCKIGMKMIATQKTHKSRRGRIDIKSRGDPCLSFIT